MQKPVQSKAKPEINFTINLFLSVLSETSLSRMT